MTGKDEQFDRMTKEPVSRLVVSLAIPAIVSMMITSVYNLVDTAFVGTLGTSASGATGIVFGFMAIIQAFGFMFGQGAGSIVARALGEQDVRRASMHASLGVAAAFASGLVIALASFWQLDRVVRLLGSTPHHRAVCEDLHLVHPGCGAMYVRELCAQQHPAL